jgi:hypothetical protein
VCGEEIDSDVANLRKAGLTRIKKMETIGIVSGDADPANVEKLKEGPGGAGG